MERVKYNGTIKPNLATNSSARSFIVSVDPNSNNAASWDRGYHFNDVNTVAPVHSNGLTSSKIVGSNADISAIQNTYSWNATHNNAWKLTELAHAGIDPYTYYGNLYDPVKTTNLIIEPGSSPEVQVWGQGYAGYNNSTSWTYFLQPAGNPGAVWAKRMFTATPNYVSTLINPNPSILYFTDVSPVIPKSQSLTMRSLSFPDSITARCGDTTNASIYTVASGYTVNNVTLSPFRMLLAVINNQGSWVYCYIPLHVAFNHASKTFTFKKNNNGLWELAGAIAFDAYLDRECLRACQNYLKAGISSGSFNGDTKSYFPMLDWEPKWRFSSLPGSGTGESSLSSNGHTSKFRVTWSVYKSDHSKYQVSNIEQIQ